jgi:hypothetical protein
VWICIKPIIVEVLHERHMFFVSCMLISHVLFTSFYQISLTTALHPTPPHTQFFIPTGVHSFSASVLLSLFFWNVVDCPILLLTVLTMSEHFANEEAWTPDRLCRRHCDTLARTCCAA